MFTKTAIEKYFQAEKRENLLFIFLGIAGIVISLVGLFYWKTKFWQGASVPLMLIALIQLIIGYTVYARSDKQRTGTVSSYDLNALKLQNEELQRMEEMNKNFVIYRRMEIILIVAGIMLALVYKNNPDKQFVVGIGVALSIEAVLMLWADIIAEKRAYNYTKRLQTFLQDQR